MTRIMILLIAATLALAGCGGGAGVVPAAVEDGHGVPPAAIPDSDKDGVADRVDECPSTLPGLAVDCFGCPTPLYLKLVQDQGGARDELGLDSVRNTEKLGRLMRDNPRTTLEIVSRVSGPGSAEEDLALSSLTAREFKSEIVERFSISEERIIARGERGAGPLALNPAENPGPGSNRVQFILSGYYSKASLPRAMAFSSVRKGAAPTRAMSGGLVAAPGFSMKRAERKDIYSSFLRRVRQMRAKVEQEFAAARLAEAGEFSEPGPLSAAGPAVIREGLERPGGKITIVSRDQRVSISFEPLNFDSYKTELDEDFRARADRIADFLVDNAGMSLVIEGHADSSGRKSENKLISMRRAESVKDYLVKTRGLSPDRISTVAFGDEHPVADNSTVEGRRLNRRVEFRLASIAP